MCVNGKCLCRNNITTDDCLESSFESLKNNVNKNRKLNNNTINIKSKEIFDFHFIQKDNLNSKNYPHETKDLNIKKAIKIEQENEMRNDFTKKLEKKVEENSKKSSFSIIDEKTGTKFEYNPDGIYVGKETIDKIIYTALIILLFVCSIILTMYLSKKFSK
jgi:hypothetical protein